MTAPTEDPKGAAPPATPADANQAALTNAAAQLNAEAENTPPAPPVMVMDAADAGDEAPLEMVSVLIDRDAHTRIPAQVMGYEVPIMLEIYGEDRVFVTDRVDFDSSNFDVEAAYDSLRNKYRKHEAALKTVYRSLGAFEKAIGKKATGAARTSTARDKQSSSKVHKPAATKAAGKR